MATVPEFTPAVEPQAEASPLAVPEQAPSAPHPSVIADQLAQTESRQRQDFMGTMQTVGAVNPDQFAKATAVEKATGIPADVLHRNQDRLNQLLKGNEYAQIFDNYRKTADAVARDGKLAAVSQDDLKVMSMIEHAGQYTKFNEQSTGEKLINAVHAGMLAESQSTNVANADKLQGIRNWFDRIDAESARVNGTDEQAFGGNALTGFGADYLASSPADRQAMRDRLLGSQANLISNAVTDEQKQQAIPTDAGAVRTEELGGGGGAAISAAMENPGYAVRSVAQALPGMVPMLVAGAVGGVPGAVAVGASGRFDSKFLGVLREEGVDLNSPKSILDALQNDELMSKANHKAALYTAAATPIDALGMGLAGKLLAPLSLGGKTLSAVQREGISLAAQVPVQAAAAGGAEAAGQLAADGKVDSSAVVMAALTGGAMSGASVGAFGGGRVFANIKQGLAEARMTRTGQAALGDMVAAARESKTKERSTDAFNALASEQLKDSPIEMLSIPAEKLGQLNQSGKTPLSEALAAIPGMTEQYAEAQARGGSVSIKTADYLAHLEPYHEQLESSIRYRPEGKSADEVKAWQEQQEKEINDIAESMNRDPDEKDQAFAGVMSELLQTGYRRQDAEQYAAQHVATLSTLATRRGLPLAEVMKRFPLDIRNKAPDQIQRIPVDDMRLAIQRLRTGDIPNSDDIFGKTLFDYVRDAGGLKDDGGEVSALDADVGKVGNNRIIRKNGMSSDDAAMRAWERGYFPGVPREEVTPQLLHDALARHTRGEPTYSVEQENPNLRDQAVNLHHLQEYFDKLGVNINAMTDDQVLNMLRNPEEARGTKLDNQVSEPLPAREDGESSRVGSEGLTIVHGSGNDKLSIDDIQIVRASGQKQGKKGRVYGGLYGTSEGDAAQAQGYAKMMGGTPTLFDVRIKPGTGVLNKSGDITRLSEKYIKELTDQGYGVVTGKDPRGRDETVVIDRNAIESVGKRGEENKQLNQSGIADRQKNFAKWFGESKVVDADGGPLVVYHGTAGDIEKFDPFVLGSSTGAKSAGMGFFFTSSADVASGYAKLSKSRPELRRSELLAAAESPYLNESLRAMLRDDAEKEVPTGFDPKDPHWIDEKGGLGSTAGANVMPLFLSIKNPLVHDFEGKQYREQTFAKLVEKAKADGHDGAIFRNADDSIHKDHDQISDIYVAFKPEQIKSAIGNDGGFSENDARILRQSTQVGPRGFITFNEPKQGEQRMFQITLTGRRDMSTLSHELGHYYLEVVNDLAGDHDAPQQMKDDVAAIRKWTGADESGRFTTEQHEQFARGFEAYLAEGKAPSAELHGAFARFKRWIIGVYKDLRRLDVELSPEIRAVMDRLIATDDQIREAEQVSQALPMFESAAKAGMTDAEFRSYQESVELAHDEATIGVEKQVQQEEERRNSAWWKEQAASVRREVAEEVDTQPEYAALKALRSGVMPDGSVRNIKLSSAEIKEQYGKAVLQKLAFLHSKKDGAPMDIVAAALGFASGDEMIKAILSAPKREDVIQAETAQRMMERHGAKASGESAEKAMSAVHNEKRGAVLIKELHALAKQGNRKNVTSQEILRRAAERITEDRKVRDLTPFEYQRAEAKAGRAAFEAAAKGDLEEAYRQKQAQLLNFHLWREASKARDAVDSIVDRMAKFNKKGVREKLGKAGHDYLDQIDGILAQYEFAKISLKTLDRRKSFEAWYADQVAAGNDPMVPEFVIQNRGVTNYKDLTYSQVTELDEFAANVNHLANLKTKLMGKSRIADIKEAQGHLSRALYDNLKTLPPRHISEGARSLPEVAMDWLKKGNSSLLKMEQIVEWADGGDVNGPWSTLFFQPLGKAQHERDTLNKQITKKVVDLTNEWFAARGTKKGDIFKVRGVETPLTTNAMLAVALNTGNRSNHDKLLRGRGWDQSIVDEILTHMTEPDWRYVEKMFETVESLWPHIVELEKKVNGIAPEKIEGVTIQTPFGDVKGGYWPLIYDPLSSAFADAVQSKDAVSPLNEKGSIRATPPRGHTKARVDNFAAPILLDVGVIGHHLDGVIHDLTHRIPLANARRLLRDQVGIDMDKTLGPSIRQQFSNMLDGIASDGASGDSRAIGAMAQTMAALRTNQAVAWMGYSATTALSQLGGYAQALDYFAQKGGRTHMAQAFAKYWATPIENNTMIRSMSPEMDNRALNLDLSMRDARKKVIRMKDGRTVQDALKTIQNGRDVMMDYAFVPIQVTQSVVDNVVWMAGYSMEGGNMAEFKKARALGKTLDEATAEQHERAVQAADRAVRLTQTAAGAKDLATIQQNNFARFFMPVYGYASLLWNRNVDIARSAKQGIKERSPAKVMVAFERFVYLNLLPAMFSALVKSALPGQPKDDDKHDNWPKWVGVNSLLGVTQGIPLVGPATAGFFSQFGYGGASAIGDAIGDANKALHGHKGQAIATATISALGGFTGIPAAQINRAVRTKFMLESGEMNDSAASVLHGILLGPNKKHP